MSKTYSIDTSTPASGESPRLGDDKIRELKLATVELMQVDHYMGTPTGTAYDSDDAGKHVKVTFRESQTVKPSIGTDKGMLYTKGETPELFYEDSAGNETQLTDQGKIPFTSLNNLANDTYLKAKDPAGTGTVDLIKAGRNEADDADVAVLPDAARLATNAAPTEATQIANKKYVDDAIDATGLVWSDHVNITAVGGKYTAPGTGVLLVQIGNYAHAGWHHNVDLYNSSNTLLFTFRAAAGYNSYSSHTVPVNTGDYITITGLHLGTPSVHFKGIGIAT
jgi:hypothetical protein